MSISRREFLKSAGAIAVGAFIPSCDRRETNTKISTESLSQKVERYGDPISAESYIPVIKECVSDHLPNINIFTDTSRTLINSVFDDKKLEAAPTFTVSMGEDKPNYEFFVPEDAPAGKTYLTADGVSVIPPDLTTVAAFLSSTVYKKEAYEVKLNGFEEPTKLYQNGLTLKVDGLPKKNFVHNTYARFAAYSILEGHRPNDVVSVSHIGDSITMMGSIFQEFDLPASRGYAPMRYSRLIGLMDIIGGKETFTGRVGEKSYALFIHLENLLGHVIAHNIDPKDAFKLYMEGTKIDWDLNELINGDKSGELNEALRSQLGTAIV